MPYQIYLDTKSESHSTRLCRLSALVRAWREEGKSSHRRNCALAPIDPKYRPQSKPPRSRPARVSSLSNGLPKLLNLVIQRQSFVPSISAPLLILIIEPGIESDHSFVVIINVKAKVNAAVLPTISIAMQGDVALS